MIITLCSSARFFDKLLDIKNAFELRGYEVLLPSMINYHHLGENALVKIHYNLIRDHFARIERSDAIYVANYDKDGIAGYIGGSAFLEIGKAFDKSIPIFLLNPIPQKISYREELLAMQPIVVGQNWDMVDHILKEKTHF